MQIMPLSFIYLGFAIKGKSVIVLFLGGWGHNSAVIEHTNRVIYLEDDDVAAVVDGRLSIHRIKRTAGDYPARAIQTLQLELQELMKGEWRISLCSVPSINVFCSCMKVNLLIAVCNFIS